MLAMDEPQSRQMLFRVTETELAEIKRKVAAAGISQNRWLRSKVLGTPDGTPGNIPTEPPVSPEKNPNGKAFDDRVRQLQAQGNTGPVARQMAEKERSAP